VQAHEKPSEHCWRAERHPSNFVKASVELLLKPKVQQHTLAMTHSDRAKLMHQPLVASAADLSCVVATPHYSLGGRKADDVLSCKSWVWTAEPSMPIRLDTERKLPAYKHLHLNCGAYACTNYRSWQVLIAKYTTSPHECRVIYICHVYVTAAA